MKLTDKEKTLLLVAVTERINVIVGNIASLRKMITASDNEDIKKIFIENIRLYVEEKLKLNDLINVLLSEQGE